MTSHYLYVALGGALGSVVRFWLSGIIARHFGETFPWGTLIINVTGSFAIGFFAALTSPEGRWFVAPGIRNLFMAGLLGGYTTFSSFSLQTLNLAENGEYGRAAGNALASMAGCLVAVWLGHILAQSINSLKGH
jgi:CrcB protein